MEKEKLTFNKIIAPITFLFFIFLIIGVFLEDIVFFKKLLDKTFTEQSAPKIVEIDLNALSLIGKKINVSDENIPLLAKEQP
jgi:hypothetical protein